MFSRKILLREGESSILIQFNKTAKNIIEDGSATSKLIVKGPAGCGKSSILRERYRFMVEQLHVPSRKILVLLRNGAQLRGWRNLASLSCSSSVWITSYYGFIQGEIKDYYPIILNHCNEIVNKTVKPVFLTFEAAQFLVSKVIEAQCAGKDAFCGATAYDARIAAELTASVTRAASSCNPYHESGSRLYRSLELKDEVKSQIFKDGDGILNAYRKKCMELGIFDFGMAVELYNNCLLKDRCYKGHLLNRISHLFVDNIEGCVPTETDFIELLLPDLASCLLSYSHEGTCGGMLEGNHAYVGQRLLERCKVVELKKTHTCSGFMNDFSGMLFDTIESHKEVKFAAKDKDWVESIPDIALRSEMLEKAGGKICELITGCRYRPSDIIVISTYADPVTEYIIGNILEKQGCRLKNLAAKNGFIDNLFTQALITLAQLCHPSYGIPPNREDVKAFVKLMLKTDPVRSSLLAGYICAQKPVPALPEAGLPGIGERMGRDSIEKYEYIRQWIRDYRRRGVPLPVGEFLQRAFLEVMLSAEADEKDITEVNHLIDSAVTFEDTVSSFKRNGGRDFLSMIRSGMKAKKNMFETEKQAEEDFVLLSTPTTYLANSLNSKIVVLLSLSSENWMPGSMKELGNTNVLAKTWRVRDICTEEIEQVNQKHSMAVLLRAIMKRCGEKLMTFEPDLSANALENDGLLSAYFDEILN